ncbi:hypothetical protein [Pararobbsia silviterrae]|uniref:hypothetical protein n=1 Tax=Pararobbsia silviterrae TaxID=1792498 RepID=UPI0019804068|nr:hypothetical protein [Pararobbsia silviterrae]
MVWTDMQLGPAGSPRPDVYAVPKSYAKFTPIAYECKISVADFRRDVTAGKWTKYLSYAAGVVFCVPQGLIGKADIPHGCGLMVRGAEGWHTVKGPTLRAVDNLPLAAWQKLLIDGVGRQRAEIRDRASSVWGMSEQARTRLGDTVMRAVQDHARATTRLRQATEQLEAAAKDAQRERDRVVKDAVDAANREAARIDEGRRALCDVLGLEPTSSAYAIARAATDVAHRLNRDDEIVRLRRELDRVRAAVTAGLEPLPDVKVIEEPDDHVSEISA